MVGPFAAPATQRKRPARVRLNPSAGAGSTGDGVSSRDGAAAAGATHGQARSSGATLLGDPVGERDGLPVAAARPRPALLDRPSLGRMAEQLDSPDGLRVDAPLPDGLGRRMTHGQLPTRSKSTIAGGLSKREQYGPLT